MNVLAGTFNQEKALVGAFCVIEKLLSKGSFSSSNTTYNVTQCGDTDKDPREYMGKGQCLWWKEMRNLGCFICRIFHIFFDQRTYPDFNFVTRPNPMFPVIPKYLILFYCVLKCLHITSETKTSGGEAVAKNPKFCFLFYLIADLLEAWYHDNMLLQI